MGAAGVGISVALMDAGIENFVALERHEIGASFIRWPAEMRFITPSFPTNSVGMLDINSVVIGTSPAFALQVEHPTGRQYAAHLLGVAAAFKLPVIENIDVSEIVPSEDLFHIETCSGRFTTKHVIWAGGDFQYPSVDVFPGSQNCQHIGTISSYAELEGDDFIIVGGYESGVDAAVNLARRGKRVRLFDTGCPWKRETSDPSVALSTYTLERMRTASFIENVELFPHTPITSVTRRLEVNDGQTESLYEVTTLEGEVHQTRTNPILAAGFAGSHTLISDLFERRDDGFPLLNRHDESTLAPGLFLCGPAVRHGDQIFCFIYKYRQRFAVVAKAIATSLGLPAEHLEGYRNWGMYLDDLSICGQECVC
ncbi:MAG: monooxygenase [Deltaproteobacteria bacterium]|nr:monooxygenase [Deltaproteobacteria bacterium]